jgi:hypothetical protein
MNLGRILKTAIVVAIVYMAVDYLALTYVLGGYMSGLTIINTSASMITNLILDLLAALTLAWVFDRVRGSFGAGAGGGVTFGLYAGFLIQFPTWLSLHVWIKDFPYNASWVFTIYGIITYIVLGAVAGWAYDMGEKKAA